MPFIDINSITGNTPSPSVPVGNAATSVVTNNDETSTSEPAVNLAPTAVAEATPIMATEPMPQLVDVGLTPSGELTPETAIVPAITEPVVSTNLLASPVNVLASDTLQINNDKAIKEVSGPDFDLDDNVLPAGELNTADLESKLETLGNVTPTLDAPAVVETPIVDPFAFPQPEVPQQPVEITPVIPEVPVVESVQIEPTLEVSPVTPTPLEAVVPVIPEITPVVNEIAPVIVPEVQSIPVEVAQTPAPALDLPALKPLDEQAAEDNATVVTLRDILRQGIDLKCSDVHISAGYRAIARVDGKLMQLKTPTLSAENIQEMLKEVVASKKNINLDNTYDLDLAYELPEDKVRFRVNIFRQNGSLAAVFRLIATNIKTIEELGLPPILRELASFSNGLVLVTGPTGSGKSSTLAALLNWINLNSAKHVITIEDPIEYIYPKSMSLIDQREVYKDTLKWEDALVSSLRQDPDVVLIGEMRDLATVSAALRIAETGHLVFATLHTNSAAQTIDRIIDFYPETNRKQVASQLANVIRAVVSQRLVPVNQGGRSAAIEIMLGTTGVKNAIREGNVYLIDNMIQTGADVGMVPLEKSLAAMVKGGKVSAQVAQAYANKVDDFLKLVSA